MAKGFEKSYGKVEVPLSHQDPDGEKIGIVFVKISKPDVPSNRPPIFFLSGGPGQSAIAMIERNLKNNSVPKYIENLLKHSAVYFIDQRGIGLSGPKLKCLGPDSSVSFSGGDQNAYVRQISAIATHCLRSIGAEGRRINLLNTHETMLDLEQIRDHIGAGRVILVGVSYGTHLALAYINQYTERVERAVLYLVEGLDQTFKLPSQYDIAIQKIDKLRTGLGLPAVEPLIRQFLRELKDNDGKYLYLEKTTRKPTHLHLSVFEAQLMLKNYATRRGLTRLYRILKNRDHRDIQKAVERIRQLRIGSLKYYATDCASYASAGRLQRIKSESKSTILGDAINFPFPYVCDALGIIPLDDKFRVSSNSQVPVLALSGGLDFKTPPGNVEHLQQVFSSMVHIVEDQGYHRVCNREKCHHLVRQFLLGSISTGKNGVIHVR